MMGKKVSRRLALGGIVGGAAAVAAGVWHYQLHDRLKTDLDADEFGDSISNSRT